MSVLSDFENRISRAVEGAFAGVFRSPVQPAELAKALGREMDRGRKVGVGKVYAPTVFTVLLSPKDDESLGGFADTLAGELATYLVGHAREHSYSLAMRPVVRFMVEPGLKLGRFEVYGELLSPEEARAELAAYADEFRGVEPPLPAEDEEFETPREPSVPGGAAAAAAAGAVDAAPSDQQTRVGGPVTRASRPPSFSNAATVTVTGIEHDVVLRGDRMVAGRLADSDIQITDANSSRHHAAFVREGAGWAVEDLNSTNGTLVNGERITKVRLQDGDVVVIGVTELRFHEPRGRTTP